MKYDLSQLMNSQENQRLAQKVLSDGSGQVSILCHDNGKIYNSNPIADGYIDPQSWLVNVGELYNVGKAVAAGGSDDLYEKNTKKIYSQEYQTILEEAEKQQQLIEKNPGLNPRQLLAVAGAGPLVETAYETVRRVNYIKDIVGPQYVPSDYNAINAVEITRVQDLNFKGFNKSSSLLQGIGQIGDHTIPDLVKQTFASYEVSLYADAIRYEFSMREKRDSVPNLESEIRKELPGAIARLKDDRITTALNAITDAGAIAPNWDAVSGSFFTGDAAGDIEADEEALDTYRAPLVSFMPRIVFRNYVKNIQAALIAEPSKSVSSTSPGRSGTLMSNPAVKYFINSSMTAAEYTIVSKGVWRRLFKGPDMTINYKNQMTPGQVEGRIFFDFNVLSGDIISAAGRLHTSVI